MQSTIISICSACNRPIKLGEPIRAYFDSDIETHINCPPSVTIEDDSELDGPYVPTGDLD